VTIVKSHSSGQCLQPAIYQRSRKKFYFTMIVSAVRAAD